MSFISNLYEPDNTPMRMLVFNKASICIKASNEHPNNYGYTQVELLNKTCRQYSLCSSLLLSTRN